MKTFKGLYIPGNTSDHKVDTRVAQNHFCEKTKLPLCPEECYECIFNVGNIKKFKEWYDKFIS